MQKFVSKFPQFSYTNRQKQPKMTELQQNHISAIVRSWEASEPILERKWAGLQHMWKWEEILFSPRAPPLASWKLCWVFLRVGPAMLPNGGGKGRIIIPAHRILESCYMWIKASVDCQTQVRLWKSPYCLCRGGKLFCISEMGVWKIFVRYAG